MTVVLEAIGLSKQFAGVTALENVSIQLKAGTVHALLGENGAGKSTLVKCIMGYYTPDTGELVIDNKQQDMRNPVAAHDLGIGMVYQHFTCIPNMTVTENMVLARSHLPAVIDWQSERQTIKEKMQNLPFTLPLDASVDNLAAGEKQKLEIIKQLMLDVNILILDEPTSVLTPNEADEVLTWIQTLVREKQMAVLMITHKFREVTRYADEVTVLRKGRFAGHGQVADMDVTSLANLMMGREYQGQTLQRRHTSEGQAVFSLKHLSVLDDHGLAAIDDLSLAVHAGEIVGIAGVSGNGQKQLMEAVAGQRPVHAGVIEVKDKHFRATRKHIRDLKVHCLPEEPLRNACVAGMTVAENLAFRRFDIAPQALGGWWLNRRAMNQHAQQLIERFSIKTPDTATPVGYLSGGNIQRTVLARELSEKVDVLIIANPCFGLDFHSMGYIHGLIMDARNNGAAVLLISEDLDEILTLSDRFYVLSNGNLVHETQPAQADLTTVGRYMAGHS